MEEQTKPQALVWFTGVISKFNVADCNLDKLELNHSLLEKLQNQYDLICIINYPTKEIADKYKETISENHITDCKFIFIPYTEETNHFEDIFDKILEQIPNVQYYIDYSKSRLIKAANRLQSEKCIHLSQLF